MLTTQFEEYAPNDPELDKYYEIAVEYDVPLLLHCGALAGQSEFHSYLEKLITAGLGKRIMFGSDQMIWPEAIGLGIEAIESASFLSQDQKRDILYNNAARFLRLTEDEVANHHKTAAIR